MNATDTRLRDLIRYLLTADAVAVDYDGLRRGKREEGEERVSKQQIQPECGE